MDRDEHNNNSTSLYDSDSSEKSFASDYKPHVKYGKRKAARTKRSSYQSVSNELRAKLVRLVIEEGKKIKPTAKILGVNYSTAKSILQIYRKEGRVDKKLYAPGDENTTTSDMVVEMQQKIEKRSEDAECEQRKADRRYPLRERKICERNETLELPRPKHRSIEPKLQKLVKKMSVDTADQSLTSAESQSLEIKEEASKPVDNSEQTLFPKIFAAAQPIDAKLDENLKVIVGAPAENEVKKPFRSNVGFVAVKSTPKPIHTDHKEAFSTQSLMPLIFNANNQINPIYLINLGLCGFFKFQN